MQLYNYPDTRYRDGVIEMYANLMAVITGQDAEDFLDACKEYVESNREEFESNRFEFTPKDGFYQAISISYACD